jgi:hypothetical protein
MRVRVHTCSSASANAAFLAPMLRNASSSPLRAHASRRCRFSRLAGKLRASRCGVL